MAENETNSQNFIVNNASTAPHKNKRSEIVQNTNQVVGNVMVVKEPKNVKTSAAPSKSFNKPSKNLPKEAQSKLAVQNKNKADGSLSQILDDIEKKRQHKEEVKSINEIITKEMQSAKKDPSFKSKSIKNQSIAFEGGNSEQEIIELNRIENDSSQGSKKT